MENFDRRQFLRLLGRASALGLVGSASIGSYLARAEAQVPSGMLPLGRRFWHFNWSNGGLGWLFTALCPPSYKDTADRSNLAVWNPTLPLDEVITARGGRFVLPRPLLGAFEANGDRGALERVLDGCVVFFGCGTGAAIHQTYAPSFQLTINNRTSDVSSEVAARQTLSTPFPLLNLSDSPLLGAGARSFLQVKQNDVAQLFAQVTNSAGFGPETIREFGELVHALSPEATAAPYARTLATQLLAAREGTRLFQPDTALLPLLSVDEGFDPSGVPGAQPLLARLARRDLIEQFTQGGTNTYSIGASEVGQTGAEMTRIARGAASLLAAAEHGVGAENAQLDGLRDDPHNRIAELHAAPLQDVEGLMLIKLTWLFGVLVELEKKGLFAETTVLVDGDFSRVLDRQFDDGGVNAAVIFSGTGRLRPGFYGDSNAGSDGRARFSLPDLAAAAQNPGGPVPLLPSQTGGGSDLPPGLALALVLVAMGLSPEAATREAALREDHRRFVQVFSRI